MTRGQVLGHSDKLHAMIVPMHDYDRLSRYYDAEFDHDDDLAMYVRLAQHAGDCLELGCGTGRCAIAVAASGVGVVGIDASARMLELGRAKAQRADVADRIELRLGDMRDFAIERAFALATIPFGSIMCLSSREDQRATIACAARHLRSGGRLVIDVFNPDVDMPPPELEGRSFVCCTRTLPTGEHVLHARTMRHDREAQVLSVTDAFRETDAAGESTLTKLELPLLYLRVELLSEMTTAAGLDVEGVFGDYALEPFHAESPRIVLVAKRP